MKSIIATIREHAFLAAYAPPIAYALSGGSAKGFFHIGMMQELEEKGILPSLVTGTSAGAVVGSLYCKFGNTAEVIRRLDELFASSEYQYFSSRYFGQKHRSTNDFARTDGVSKPEIPEPGVPGWKRLADSVQSTIRKGIRIGQTLSTQAMVDPKDAAALFAELLRGVEFTNLRIPFAAVSTNLATAKAEVYGTHTDKTGVDLADAVQASAAIPFIFPAVEIQGISHVDGYLVSNLPVKITRKLAGEAPAFVIGFDVSSPLEREDDEFSTADLALRLLDIAAGSVQESDREAADILFRPVRDKYSWSSFNEYKRFINAGREYMQKEYAISRLENAWLKAVRTSIAGEPSIFRRWKATRALEKIIRQAG